MCQDSWMFCSTFQHRSAACTSAQAAVRAAAAGSITLNCYTTLQEVNCHQHVVVDGDCLSFKFDTVRVFGLLQRASAVDTEASEGAET